MKNEKRKIFLRILGATVIVAFLGKAQFSYGQSSGPAYGQPSKPGVPTPKPPLQPIKVAIWKITKMEAKPSCYKKPPKGAPDFIYEVRMEFKATPASRPAGNLLIEGRYVSNFETVTTSLFNLTDATRTWAPGTTGTITWDADVLKVTKVTPHHFILVKPDCRLSWKVDGVTPLRITVIAHTYVGTVRESTDTKLLIINPCR